MIDLDAIWTRWEQVAKHYDSEDPPEFELVTVDIPHLLAEVERLRAALVEILRMSGSHRAEDVQTGSIVDVARRAIGEAS